ncbi:MAG TPA: hypothetical protein VNO84_11625 [Burkholderiaceae bacterium]|nr:hypothetical protein [Burkholderiaceae bacterium]
MFDPMTWDTALTIGADPSYNTPRLAETQTTDALGSMQPIQDTGSAFSDFWGGVGSALQGLLGYAIVKDAAKSGLVQTPSGGFVPGPGFGQQPQQQPGIYVPAPQGNMTMLLLLAGVGVLAVVALRGK